VSVADTAAEAAIIPPSTAIVKFGTAFTQPELVLSGESEPAPVAAELDPIGGCRPSRRSTSPRFELIDVLVDADALSHGLAEDAGTDRASNDDVAACLVRIRKTVHLLIEGTSARSGRYAMRCAGSTATARHHLDLVVDTPNNTWAFCRGLDGADRVLLDRLEGLAAELSAARRRPIRGAKVVTRSRLVMLVGQDHIYAPAVDDLRRLGVPTWVLQPGRFIAAALYKAACAVTPLRPVLGVQGAPVVSASVSSLR
jgi:hypothetical protein